MQYKTTYTRGSKYNRKKSKHILDIYAKTIEISTTYYDEDTNDRHYSAIFYIRDTEQLDFIIKRLSKMRDKLKEYELKTKPKKLEYVNGY